MTILHCRQNDSHIKKSTHIKDHLLCLVVVPRRPVYPVSQLGHVCSHQGLNLHILKKSGFFVIREMGIFCFILHLSELDLGPPQQLAFLAGATPPDFKRHNIQHFPYNLNCRCLLACPLSPLPAAPSSSCSPPPFASAAHGAQGSARRNWQSFTRNQRITT